MHKIFKSRSPRHRAIPAPSLPVQELLVARWHGLTPDEWCALPAIVKVDHREAYYRAWGMAS